MFNILEDILLKSELSSLFLLKTKDDNLDKRYPSGGLQNKD